MPLRIPLEFVLANANLNWSDVRFGLEQGFLDCDEAIRIAVDNVSRRDDANSLEIELAGLFRDESYRVPELIAALTANSSSETELSKKRWCYLSLAWLYEHRETFDDPLQTVAEIYDDFDFPEEVACFVNYMPPRDGYRPQDHSRKANLDRLYCKWHEYVIRNRLK